LLFSLLIIIVIAADDCKAKRKTGDVNVSFDSWVFCY